MEIIRVSCAMRKAAPEAKYHGLSPGQISSRLTSKPHTTWTQYFRAARSKIVALGPVPWKIWVFISSARIMVMKQGVRF
jgi:hypothetical protein